MNEPISREAVNHAAVTHTFNQLSEAAVQLNSESDRLNEYVKGLDEHLKRLNLGLSGWVSFSAGPKFDNSLGYARVKGKWGLALRREEQNEAGEWSEETWLFNDGPRWMRLDAIGYIAVLFEKLTIQAQNMTKLIQKRILAANELVEALKVVTK